MYSQSAERGGIELKKNARQKLVAAMAGFLVFVMVASLILPYLFM